MPRFNMKTLWKRVISASILIPVTLWIIWTGKYMFSAFCIIGAGLSMYEWRLMAIKLPRPYLHLILGFGYIALAGVCFYLLRSQFSFQVSMVCIVLVWASDTGAYFTGKFIGGPKLAKDISPNKTWAGFGGALVTPGLVAMVWAAIYGVEAQVFAEYILMYLFCFMTGALMGTVGQGGDLAVSYFKRRSGVKDTGRLIPGHGGILDRIDSLLPNIPVFYAIALAVKYAFS